MDIYEKLEALQGKNTPCAIAIVVESSGSTPAKIGSKILVTSNGLVAGTVGGGSLESKIIDMCKISIKDGQTKTVPFLFDEKHDYMCGGNILVYIEPILGTHTIIIAGAGHVGKALSHIAKFCGFNIVMIDDRNDFANAENIPDADRIIVGPYVESFNSLEISKRTFIVIVTRDHKFDYEVAGCALKTDAGYVGLMGSKSKKRVLFNKLKEAGFEDEDLERLIIPIGLSIGSTTPEEIGLSIMAQIISYLKVSTDLKIHV